MDTLDRVGIEQHDGGFRWVRRGRQAMTSETYRERRAAIRAACAGNADRDWTFDASIHDE